MNLKRFISSCPTAWSAKRRCWSSRLKRQAAAHAAAEKLAEWGRFVPAELRELKEQGWEIHIYRTDKKTMAALEADPDVRFVRLAPVGKMPTLAAFAPLPGRYSATEFPVPDKEQQSCDKALADCEAFLTQAAAHLPSIRDQLLKTQNAAEYSAVSNTSQSQDGLVWLSGYLPAAEVDGFKKAAEEHQKKSQAGAEQKFHGGLADHSEATAQLHTATHLLDKALKVVLSDDVHQCGSNITAERLRFDFNWPEKVTPEQLKAVEDLVNQQIQRNLPVVCKEMTLEEAKKTEAIGIFESKYGERVKVYSIGDFSTEICGGPHANNTSELGHFKIVKEESSSRGIRRIKAILEK